MDDLRIKGLALPEKITKPGLSAGVPDAQGPAFAQTLKESIDKVNTLQLEADRSIQALSTGESQNLHQTMISMEKARVSFELMMQVKNKIITAYEEMMRMQI
jgi:flagellar hook-basal body complex protein FliE